MERSFTEYAKRKIKNIHYLSNEYNGMNSRHTEVLLELVEKHSIEIKELFGEKNEHFLIEVGDLLILCMEILLEQEKDLDEILNECYRRYETKLKGLILNRKKQQGIFKNF